LRKGGSEEEIRLFEEVYERHFDSIYRYVLLRVGERADAEDLVQEIFLKVLQALPSYKPKGLPISAWLFRIARNHVIDFLRRKKREESKFTREEISEVSALEDPLREAELRADLKRVKEALRDLTDLQREVIALRFGAGLSVAETAKAMGKTENAVKALQHSAISALRRRLRIEEEERE